ncbi:hypothetical protein [Confluentibacter flavum]|uniref:DUF4297 domain-containing protein n=1 Tax=Confluentibacter flavum TaxID=1909700 RepID=A0A2N3HM90_9FLAO|nr:hypothetical protein [Confluentibacter flavum]PKQ46079.1 hypothetical protein CSW08_04880 [Confluentibacter flavum]
MEINKLHIFSKDTDAFSSQRGYNYQTLKTLETWVNNFLEDNNEEIYCEFEEDIFQKDNLNNSLKFRQLKLYKSNFSFSSDEVRKCIAHFFMLHIKYDYNDFQKEFIFETNSNIAGKRLENDAELLKDWYENQDVFDFDKFKIYSVKVKEIVSEYIQKQKKSLEGELDDKLLAELIEIFDIIDDDFWLEFTKLIKWKFIGISSEEEFIRVKSNIENLILKLPFSENSGNESQAFGVLLEKVFSTTSQEKPENRKLTLVQLEQLMLNIGSEDDKWYSKGQLFYSKINKIDTFRIGEFYEILDLVNYCRRKRYLHKHKALWNAFLGFYTKNENILPSYKRKAIYELVFLNNEFYEVDYNNLKERVRPKGSLFGFEEEIRYYLNDFNSFQNADELEKAQNIMNVLLPVVFEQKVNISENDLKLWLVNLYKEISRRFLSERDINEKCRLIEQKGNILLSVNRFRLRSNIEFIYYYEQLLKLIDQAPLFKISQFGDRIDKYIKIHINIDPKDKMGIIQSLEDFSEKLFPFVEEREGKVKLAQKQVLRGVQYLNSSEPPLLLKALEYFHKAKDNYLQEDTIEGYILALLNISQLYNQVGMHLAAKYYALAAFRLSVNKEMVNRTEKSLAMMFYCDYKQGSWFNAINIYKIYIAIRDESNLQMSDYKEEGEITQRLAMILYYTKKTSNQFKNFINAYLKELDYIGSEIIEPIFKRIEKDIDNSEKLNKVILKEIDDFPLNDIGNERVISFYALGSLWKIKFENSFELMSIAEEYISTIQIVLSEISLSNYDFHLTKSEINIELELKNDYTPPEQLPSNKINKWKVFICHFDKTNPEAINKHTVFNTVTVLYVLNNISLLIEEEYKDLFFKLIKERGLDKKQISVNLYQRMHRDIYTKQAFDISQRCSFQKEYFPLNFPKENKAMRWDDSLSEKYDVGFSVEAIENRFNNTKKSIYITIEKLKKDNEFIKLIHSLREEGWKDWQIITNIFNFMISYKVRRFENINYTNEKEAIELINKMFVKYKNLDEKDCYIEFPVQAFKSKEFMEQFEVGIGSIIKTYGLENKSITPNFDAIKEFLDVRFNLAVDDYNENNPLKNI